jgi:3-dehydroquinate synthase
MSGIKVEIEHGKSYPIKIGRGLVLGKNSPENIIPTGSFIIVTDSNLFHLYDKFLKRFSKSVFVLSPGEQSKKIANVEKICRFGVKAGLDRSSSIVAFGGGVVGDIAGFSASIYMRGIGCVQVPTTVLAMVDSSVGGKTGANLPEGKNLIGSFWQPSRILIDPFFIKTLPEKEIKCGLAEIIKYGMILDKNLFEFLEKNIGKLLSPNLDFYEKIIAACCRLKAEIVRRDEKESGIRAILNYGHTFGHAIEKLTGYKKLSHGEAIAIGMRMSANFAKNSGLLSSEEELRQNLLLDKAGLPSKTNLSPEKIYSAMFSDKKTKVGKISIVVPRRIGTVEIIENPEKQAIIEAIRGFCA